MKAAFLRLTLAIAAVLPVQSPHSLEPLKTLEESGTVTSPVGDEKYPWGILATFAHPDSQGGGFAVLDAMASGDIIVLDRSRFWYRISSSDFRMVWKAPATSEHFISMKVSPDEKTFAVTYGVKAGGPVLEIRSASDGSLKSRHTVSGLRECGFTEEHKLTPDFFDYTRDGKMIAAVFRAGTLPNRECHSVENDALIILDAFSGKEIRRRSRFALDFWPESRKSRPEMKYDAVKCTGAMPLVFDSNGAGFFLLNCRGRVVRYLTKTLKAVGFRDFQADIVRILKNDLNRELLRDDVHFDTAFFDFRSGNLLSIFGAQGDGAVFSISANLKKISLLTVNQGSIRSRISYSPDRSLVMMNHEHLNLWDVSSGRALLYGHLYHAGDLAVFHPARKAVIFVREKKIHVLAPLPLIRVKAPSGLFFTGLKVLLDSTYCVSGTGSIRLKYRRGEDERSSYSRKENSTCEKLESPEGWKGDFTMNDPYELAIESDGGSVFDIFGARRDGAGPADRLQSLPLWGH